MATLTFTGYNTAVTNWNQAKSNYTQLKNLISPEKVFTLFPDQIQWLSDQSEFESYFRIDIGVFENQLIMIMTPQTTAGDVMVLRNYEYVRLEYLQTDLKLTQTKTYIATSNYILSKDLKKSENDTDVNFPILNQPVTGQQVAVGEIESWRENGMDWLNLESSEFNGQRIFNSFFVPKADLLQNQENATSIVCVFGLKPSPIYQRLLPTLIFISCFDNLTPEDIAAKAPSNTYDWSKPEPPYNATTLG